MTEGDSTDPGKTLYRPENPPTNPNFLENAHTNPPRLPEDEPAPPRPNFDAERGTYTGGNEERARAITQPLTKGAKLSQILKRIRNLGKGH